MKTAIELPSEHISKSFNTKKIALYLGLVLISIATLFVSNSFIQDRTSAEYMFMLVVGITGASIFSINLFINSRQLIYSKTGSPLKAHSIFFRNEEFDNLKSALDRGDCSKIVGLLSDGDSGVRLDLVISDDKCFAAYQIFKYVPHSYEPATEAITVTDGRIDGFCRTVSALGLIKS